MCKLCIFAGTTEGRELVEFLISQKVSVTACVATEYGETLLPEGENLTISAQRLSREEMVELFTRSRFDLVIDSTHPYAQSVTETILSACEETRTQYLRLLREGSEKEDDAVYVPDTQGAVDFLRETQGNILLTTGSKTLYAFSALEDFSQRIYARVLPMQASLDACAAAGVKASHILAMQGPFSEEMNLALLHAIGARYLVTKDGGSAGGFPEKASAAKKAGVHLVIIGRPPQQAGMNYGEVVELLCSRFGCTRIPRVKIVGIGPGSREVMTHQAYRAIQEADCLIGAKRMLQAVLLPGQGSQEAIAPGEIADYIAAHTEYQKFAVVMSGDTGFFSGTRKLLPLLFFCQTEVIPGISSLVCLCARLGISYEDIPVRTLHGRQYNILPDVHRFHRLFVLTGGENGMQQLARTLTEGGLGHVTMNIGERLSYPEEKITTGSAQTLVSGSYDALSVALLENDSPDAIVTHGLPDSEFLRGEGKDGIVPMTKSEVRAVCLSKLQLTENAVCWDVGAGTGSVAIEMALQAQSGAVYAIERKIEAADLLEENARRLGANRLSLIRGTAPEACSPLPAPTHVFIGGSSGNLRGIMELALQKNPHVRIVATAIALETVGELSRLMKELPFAQTEVVSMQVARDKKAGPYHLMTGQNPVYVFTLQGGEAL